MGLERRTGIRREERLFDFAWRVEIAGSAWPIAPN
jgi:hypothetical protein